MLQGGQTPEPTAWARWLASLVTEYVWRRLKWVSARDWMGPVLYRKVLTLPTVVVKRNS